MSFLTIDQLCAKHDNETVHTAHVTALAVRLFAATAPWLGIPRADRKLVAAAARLHDVGYRDDPVHHPARGAAIVRRAPLRDLTPLQRRTVAAAIPFHSGNLTGLADRPRRVQAIAAFVRVADGLDHGHVQDAEVVKVTRVRDTIRVTVRSPHFPFNLARADQKSDLWRRVFPLDIQFVPAAEPSPRPRPLVTRETPVTEAARRLMSVQFKTITGNVAGAVAGDSPEPLHDLRVALRRLRLLLRVFRKQLPKPARKPIAAALRELGDDLGPARDLDVWVEFLESPAVQPGLARSRLGRTFLEHQQRRRALRRATVRRCLRGPQFAARKRRLARLLRVNLPRLNRTAPPGDLAKLAARTLEKERRQALRWGRDRRVDDPDTLHQLRIALRRARYLGEFFGPVLGLATEKLTRCLHAVERPLGRLHDIDTGLARVRHEGPTPPRALVEKLREQRQQQVRKFETAWQRLN